MSNKPEPEIRKVILPSELPDILTFDASVFSNPGDYMSPDDWLGTQAYWMLFDGVRVGCCGLQQDVDYDDSASPGSLYVASIAISPEWRGHGFGTRFTQWQIDYARKGGFTRIVTNTRESNSTMIGIYAKLGFKVRCIADYYDDPEERAVVFELYL